MLEASFPVFPGIKAGERLPLGEGGMLLGALVAPPGFSTFTWS